MILLLSTVLRRLFLDRQAEFWLDRLSPTLSLAERRAPIVDIIDETPDTKTFVLAVRRWPGHRAGQYVPVDVEIDGKRVRRCYSITSLPSDTRRVAITVKRIPGGRVSTYLHDHARVGTVVVLGEPAGEFVLPAAARAAPKLALIAGGSGVTPVVAMLRDLRDRKLLDRMDIVVLQAARSTTDAAFAGELADLARIHAGVRVIAHRDAHLLPAGHLTPAAIGALIPDLADRVVYTCGPAPLMDVVEEAAGSPVIRERFVAAVPAAPSARPARVHLAISKQTLALDGAGTLLEQLERAGARPAHGCRMGICNTCRCTLVRGATHDLAANATATEPETSIRLCTSVARSDELEITL